MEKYVLILGAGLMQRPALEAAVQLGFRTLVVDGNPSAICASHADRFEAIDLKDVEKIVELALSMRESIAGVFTAGTDFSAAVSTVAHALSLPSHSVDSALNASNKFRMRECFSKKGIPSPNFALVSRSEIASFLSKASSGKEEFPKVVKPVDNMGARGCRMVRGREEFVGALEDAVRYSRSSRAIVEDYMEGPEFSIDAVVFNDSLTITGFADRHIFYEPYFIEMGHTLPSQASENVKKELLATFAHAVKALGLSHGVAKADIKYTSKGPMVGEIAARLSGGYMSGWTFPYASGIDLTRAALQLSVGMTPDELLQRRIPLAISGTPFAMYELPCARVSAERAWVSIPGKVSSVYFLERAMGHPFIRDVFPRTHAGDTVDFPRNNVEKCGNVIAVASENEIAVRAAENSVSKIVLRLLPNVPETDYFLSCRTKRGEDNFPPDAFAIPEEKLSFIRERISSFGAIPKNESVLPLLDQKFLAALEGIYDWNHRSIIDSLKLFDQMCPTHDLLDGVAFWEDLLRGGLQGILYLADCVSAERGGAK